MTYSGSALHLLLYQVDSIGETSIIMYLLTRLVRLALTVALLATVALYGLKATGHWPLLTGKHSEL